ncbi:MULTISPECIES: hypothetical protein [Acinetobacter]|jgi:hypothetical protein|uniref:Uncharacterized protein n=1 Tax=Acinetobacter radioresistens TaxID=40216 RepID=A0A8H2PT03_ACIRA|nr:MULTISPECIES: hypothetical protein [Acinetobacter]EXB35699.1 hypothetical protein J546_0284 [Acinetobacter sp. 1461402]EXB73576.1 hypothetical protein J550_0844 [Acinetobacter sp. 230853]EXE14795.1 hypothetical protein J559_1186 [Acinetobacter sp. 983759]KCX39357.1 hypothetical protein J577_0083 [Acinetobacter sp. 263903-1]TNX85953.1 hypothetical protein FHY67_14550 [Acinetobacter radioresistens]
MKFKTLMLMGLASIAVTACSSAPKIPQLDLGVLQEVQNLEVVPATTNNKAKLTKFLDKCVIEFTGDIGENRVVEQWSFKGMGLMNAGSATFQRDGTSKAEKFNLHDANVQKNFVTLRDHFAKEALDQCN